MSCDDRQVERGDVLGVLQDALEPLDWVHAMWQGGAAAFGRVDEWSDIDLMVQASDDQVGEVLPVVETALESLSPIALRFELPMPTWHGHIQAFYRLTHSSEYLLIDLVVLAASADRRFLQPERHGDAVVVFDKHGSVVAEPIDRDTWRTRLASRLSTLRVTFPLFQCMVTKELNRGNDVDALTYYHAYTLRPLVELLRIRHTPFQHDFGTHYLQYDLPTEIVLELTELHFVGGPGQLIERQKRAEKLFLATLSAIDDEGIVLDQ